MDGEIRRRKDRENSRGEPRWLESARNEDDPLEAERGEMSSTKCMVGAKVGAARKRPTREGSHWEDVVSVIEQANRCPSTKAADHVPPWPNLAPRDPSASSDRNLWSDPSAHPAKPSVLPNSSPNS
jgi:hypothetical protein